MLRAVSESLFRRLIEAFPPDRAYPHERFAQEPMPTLVGLFLGQTLQERLDREQDRLGHVPSDWFDVDHPAVRKAREALAAALLQHGRIPRSAWPGILEQAVDQVLHHLVRPTKTLVDFVFEDDHDALPGARVRQRLSYFGAYPYLREVVEGYFAQKNLQEIDRARFASLLQRVDEQMTTGYHAEEWLRLLEPLFDLLRAVPLTAGRGAPVALLRTFFRDKEADRIAHRLQLAEERHGLEMVSEAELHHLIDAALQPVPAPAVAALAETSPKAFSHLDPSPASPVQKQLVPLDLQGEKQALPLWMQFQRGLQPHAPLPASSDAAPPRPALQPARPSAPAPLEPSSREALPQWMQFHQDVRPPRDTGGLAQLERMVLGEHGARNRDLFVNQLFASSVAEYERVLQRLQPVSSWAQASQIIAQEVFKKQQVNIYSDPAIAFTDAVESRYREQA